MVVSIDIYRCLKRDRDIGRMAVLSDVKTAFTCTPALNCVLKITQTSNQNVHVFRKRCQEDINTGSFGILGIMALYLENLNCLYFN